jgi:hypothetical protein
MMSLLFLQEVTDKIITHAQAEHNAVLPNRFARFNPDLFVCNFRLIMPFFF